MKYFPFWLILSLLITTGVPGQTDQNETPSLDIVFCLDLSGSTNGLIDNVRENLWGVINLATSLQPSPEFRIGVVAFSRPSFGKSNFYVKQLSRLTDDFDGLQAELYKLKSEIEKGDQFVSNALEMAFYQMNWSESKNSVKIIFLIGNGSVSTGSTDYRELIESIAESGVELVPIYCLRSKPTPDQEGWSHIGRISGNYYETISVLKRDPFIKPFPDFEKLKQLNFKFNQTILPYTKDGIKSAKDLMVCDNKALLDHPTVFENRLYYKMSEHFIGKINEWDLVAACPETPEDLDKKVFELLDDSLRFKSGTELIEILKRKAAERKLIREEIKKLLPQQRQKFVNAVLQDKTFERQELLDRVLLLNIIGIAKKYTMKP